MKQLVIVSAIITLGLNSGGVVSGTVTDTYTTGDTLTATQLTNLKDAVNDNDTSKVSKSGDTMTGLLSLPTLDIHDNTTDVIARVINDNTLGSERLYFGNATSDAGIIVWKTSNISSPGKWRTFNNAGSGVAHYDWVIDGGVRMALLNNGNLGIGTSTPTLKLYVNGTAGGTSSYQVVSDEKYKKNITSLEFSLDKVMQLRGVSYDWRQEEFPEISFSDATQIGFIAQEVEPVIPEIVNIDSEGNLSVAYSSLVPVLVEAIKEQQLQIEELQKQVQQLMGN